VHERLAEGALDDAGRITQCDALLSATVKEGQRHVHAQNVPVVEVGQALNLPGRGRCRADELQFTPAHREHQRLVRHS
jgi:hypothetical protein